MNLAWWHTYKHTAFKVWEKFGGELFAGMHFTLYPGTTYYKKTTNFPAVIAHFQVLMLAYGPLQEDLNRTIAENRLSPQQMHQVKELHFILDYAIPTVRKTFVQIFFDSHLKEIFAQKFFPQSPASRNVLHKSFPYNIDITLLPAGVRSCSLHLQPTKMLLFLGA